MHLSLMGVKGKPHRHHSIPDLSLHVHRVKRFTKQANKWSHMSRSYWVTSRL